MNQREAGDIAEAVARLVGALGRESYLTGDTIFSIADDLMAVSPKIAFWMDYVEDQEGVQMLREWGALPKKEGENK